MIYKIFDLLNIKYNNKWVSCDTVMTEIGFDKTNPTDRCKTNRWLKKLFNARVIAKRVATEETFGNLNPRNTKEYISITVVNKKEVEEWIRKKSRKVPKKYRLK